MKKNFVIKIVFFVICSFLLWYFMLPPFNLHSPLFWVYFFLIVLFATFLFSVSSFEREHVISLVLKGNKVRSTISFLPVIDNLEKAVSVKTDDENYRVGVELVLKQFKEVLANNGVKEIEAVGKTFDPELHEAVSSVEDDSLGVQETKEEYRKGYMIGNKVIRHSLVVVAN